MPIYLGPTLATLPDTVARAYVGSNLTYERAEAPAGGGVEPETTALLARMTVQPEPSRAAAINTMIAALKASGAWQTLDLLYIFRSHDRQAATLNWVQDRFNALLLGPNLPMFNVNQSFGQAAGANEVTNHIQADGYNVASAVGLKHTAAGFCYGMRAHQLRNFRRPISFHGDFFAAIIETGNDTEIRIRGYGGQILYPAPRIERAHYAYSKNQPSLGTAYRDGIAIDVIADNGGGHGTLKILEHNWDPNAIRIAMVHSGGAMTTAQVQSLTDAFEAYVEATP